MRLVSQPNGNLRGNVRCDRAATSVEPNWRVMTGAGNVTAGACSPAESVKVMRTKLSDKGKSAVSIFMLSEPTNGGSTGQELGVTASVATSDG